MHLLQKRDLLLFLVSLFAIMYFINKPITLRNTKYLEPSLISNSNASTKYRIIGNNETYKVPNVVHFIWFGEKKKMMFLHYVSVLSAYKIQKPESIMFHCDHLPQGPWWEELRRKVPLKIVQRKPPETIHGQLLTHVYHQSDVVKLDVMMEYGGIYLDYDVIVLKPLDKLREYKMTIGKELSEKFNAGVVLASKESKFLRLWYDSYRDYRSDWVYNSGIVPYQIYLNNTHLVHVENTSLTTPDWNQQHLLWDIVIDWSDLYVIHCLAHLHNVVVYTPQNIKKLDTTFGQVMRFIYYGSPALIK